MARIITPQGKIIKPKLFEVKVTVTPVYSESIYLIESNKARFQEIANKKEWRQGDTMDMLLSLHIVLEVGLNFIFRKFTLFKLVKQVKKTDVIENIDNISFIDKLILFIYNSTFDFSNNLQAASEYHKIIGTLKSFTSIRNQIMHGHAVATINDHSQPVHTTLRKKLLTDKVLISQIAKYILIVNGVNFYLDNLDDASLKSHMQEHKHIINYDFIPRELIEKTTNLD